MDRRLFLTGLGVLVASNSFRVAAQCVRINPQALGCRVGLREHFHIVTQDCPERCWAASIAGIFKYNGHSIDQDVIARTMFGTLACRPSGGTKVLDAVLSREWTDDGGAAFTATIKGLYDPLNGIRDLDNNDILSEMKHDNPMLYCNKTHAMVIVGIDYQKDNDGDLIQIDQVHMADPYPGKGFHVLSPSEMRPAVLGGDMMYLASVDVD